MLGSYWEKARRIAKTIKELGTKSVRQIAQASGIPKSSVHRHLKAVERRNKHPESMLWESAEGQQWLIRLVSATIFYFGIQRGVGAETISQFFSEIRIDTHVGVSPTTVRTQRQEMERLILEYGALHQEEAFANCESIDVCGAVDESFFQEMIVLLMMDLSTGFIISEQAAQNRKYKTWKAKLESVLTKIPVKVHYLVSDRAKALIKLATTYFECQSIADLFHALHKIAQTFSFSLHNKIKGCVQDLEKIDKKLAKLTATQANKRLALEAQKTQTQKALVELQKSLSKYRQLLHQFSLTVHPFHITSGQPQTSAPVLSQLRQIMRDLQTLAEKNKIDYEKKLKSVTNQLPDIAALMDVWWDWVNQSCHELVTEPNIQLWAKTKLLPLYYWQHQQEKGAHKEMDPLYTAAYQKARLDMSNDPITASIDPDLLEELEQWARLMVKRFCRSTSAVEGRNGVLSQLNHSRRGVKKGHLPVLTVLHNFYIRRADGSTAAERFFSQEFPDLFEWLLPQIPSLPRPRVSRLAKSISPSPT